jgi:hypothetical protein
MADTPTVARLMSASRKDDRSVRFGGIAVDRLGAGANRNGVLEQGLRRASAAAGHST